MFKLNVAPAGTQSIAREIQSKIMIQDKSIGELLGN